MVDGIPHRQTLGGCGEVYAARRLWIGLVRTKSNGVLDIYSNTTSGVGEGPVKAEQRITRERNGGIGDIL